jgi:acetyltransferase
MAKPRHCFDQAGIATYGTPEQAVRAFMHLVRYRRGQRLLSETPPPLPECKPPDKAAVAALIAAALAQDRHDLTGPESRTVLEAYGVPVVSSRTGASPEEAAGIATQIAGPELILRVADVPLFGPVIRIAPGWARMDDEADAVLALPPLNLRLARELLSRGPVHRTLQGGQGQPAANADAVALTLVRLSQLVIDHPRIQSLEINPLRSDPSGVLARDASVTLAEPKRPGTGRLAIRPYPQELEEWVPIDEGRQFLLRPIRPEDEPALQDAFAKLTTEEVRLRFFVPMPTLRHEAAARLSQIDYDREMALILTDPHGGEPDAIYGVVRLIAAPDNERAEFAIIVGHPLTGRGIGTLMMRRILAYARDQGIREVFGVVLADNGPMLRLCDKLGFTRRTNPEAPGTILVTRNMIPESGHSE